MALRIRQIVVAARDLDSTVSQLQAVLGVDVCYRDPEVGKFGLHNALMAIGDQFLEVVSPTRDNTAAGRHLDRHGDSAYMLILQTDDLKRDRERLEKLSVRIVWQAEHKDIAAVHLHPKDIGGAIVSLDQPVPPSSWRWAGPDWQRHVRQAGARKVIGAMIAAPDPTSLSRRWADVLGTSAPVSDGNARTINIDQGVLRFSKGDVDLLSGFDVAVSNLDHALAAARSNKLAITGNAVTICGTQFQLSQASQ